MSKEILTSCKVYNFLNKFVQPVCIYICLQHEHDVLHENIHSRQDFAKSKIFNGQVSKEEEEDQNFFWLLDHN